MDHSQQRRLADSGRSDEGGGRPRTLILGGAGMLGQALVREARERAFPTRALNRDQVDLTDLRAVREALSDHQPQLVVNTAALTDVDGCESRREEAMRVNGEAVGHLAALAEEMGAAFVHVSSDYVFDGRSRTPYRESDSPQPLSVYGESKLLGEERALAYPCSLVVRSSWLFGPGGRNFVATIAGLARQRDELRVVDDQRGCPTYTPFLARALLDLASLGARGLVHYGNREAASWYELACAVVEEIGATAQVVPVPTAEFPRPAPRPAFSVLDTSRFEGLAGRRVESWRRGLKEYRPALLGPVLAS